ncbi:hypothetical protein PPTG_22447 [Phytophthora nicotianae INRA-310]|uniref:DDE Tnp4 domain-containing protein n=1 Tax=Phytophthora nicotianae (strain INRA-310) TaxID=761204 RepID=W2QLA4_PHYN3|nr:hypothetical protein PPTG_22447 [Phytophthora nicotianae INRA-310]ETN13040.1 hypothetical protein PPTG_22447 [Phytophthora nicotianae INRA-310]
MLWTTYLSVATSRYLYDRIGAPHRDDKFDELLALPENEFRQVTRVSKSSFAALPDYIGGNTVFNSGGTDAPHKQRPASVQIAVALARLGANGNAASVGEFHRRFNIAAGSVVVYTKRVVAALKAVRAQWIAWPSRARRREVASVMASEGFPGCVGFIDGTTLPLSQRPALDGSSYWDRKKSDKRIIAVHCGCPGSCADSNVFKRMKIYRESELFFDGGEFLLADSAYPLLQTVLPAYKSPLADQPDNAEFNNYLAMSRVRNEHAIGILKGRWSSLRELRNQLRSEQEMTQLIDWAIGCCVLHNMMARLGDGWKKMFLESDPPNQGADGFAREERSSIREIIKPITLITRRRSLRRMRM